MNYSWDHFNPFLEPFPRVAKDLLPILLAGQCISPTRRISAALYYLSGETDRCSSGTLRQWKRVRARQRDAKLALLSINAFDGTGISWYRKNRR